MWVSVILGAVVAIFLGWAVQDVLYWKGYPMDHSNLIPLAILITAIGMLLALI
tara:strand:- start:1052 stop:1210 length:159 start_codon:yes stop_codon:yes gene_type:complete